MRLRILALLTALLLPSPLIADTISFSLNTDEHGTSSPPPGSVTVTINRTSSTAASVTFTTVSSYYMDNVFINVDGDFSVGTITGTQPAYDLSPGQSLDSYGTMSEEITPHDGAPSSTITINLTAIGGNTWGSATSVLTQTCPSNDSIPSCVGGFGVSSPDSGGGYNAGDYAQGFDAMGRIGTSSTNGSNDNQDLAGFVAATPEPESLVFVGTGLIAAAGVFRRKFMRA